MSASSLLQRSLLLPLNIIRYVLSEPIITGALLFALTKGSPELKDKLLGPFQSNLLATNAEARLGIFIKALKFIFAIGFANRANQALNRLAYNAWSLRRLGTPWSWDGKTEVVLVTGGSSGFGYEFVKGFAGKAKVVALDISPFPAELAKLPDVYYYKCDVSDYAQIHSVANAIRKEVGHPSVLINNAGIGTGKSVLASQDAVLDKIFKINLVSHFVLIKEFLPAMLSNKKGHIVGISSMAAVLPVPGLLDYSCTKIGVLYLNDGLRSELHTTYPNGKTIQTTVVHPSWHKTNIVAGREDQLESFGFNIDPPTNVTDKVIAHILAGRSGKLFIPETEARIAIVRSLPIWLQDVLLGIHRKVTGFRVDDEEVKYVLLDCDNTLCLSEHLAFEACADLTNELLGLYNIDHRYTARSLLEDFVGQNFRGMMVGLQKKHNFQMPPEQLEEYVDKELGAVTKKLSEKCQECPGATEQIAKLHEQGYPLAVVSTSAKPRVVASLKKVGLDKYFPDDKVFSAATSLNPPSSKPDPKIYLFACEQLGVKPEETVTVEDSKSGATAAMRANIPTVGYVGVYGIEEGQAKMEQMATILKEQTNAREIMYDWKDFPKHLAAIEGSA
ncbi:hypothetical protein DV738_g4326, partial [Chaetothyriales sp. CBS 135597]